MANAVVVVVVVVHRLVVVVIVDAVVVGVASLSPRGVPWCPVASRGTPWFPVAFLHELVASLVVFPVVSRCPPWYLVVSRSGSSCFSWLFGVGFLPPVISRCVALVVSLCLPRYPVASRGLSPLVCHCRPHVASIPWPPVSRGGRRATGGGHVPR